MLNDVPVVTIAGVGAYRLMLYFPYTPVFFSEMQKKKKKVKGKTVLLIVNDKEGRTAINELGS